MLKFAWNFTAMFLFVFIGLAAFFGAFYSFVWVAVHFAGDYAFPIMLLAVVSGIWAASFALSEQRK